jgi:predicted nucleotidyltransferase
LIEELMAHGYLQRGDLRAFQLVRQIVPEDGGPPIDVVVDFLMPRNAQIKKNKPVLIDDFAVIRADGAELALEYFDLVTIEGSMPGGGKNRVEIAIASIPALVAMKGFALEKRLKRKDAYDIYYCVRNYPGGPEALANDCQPLLDHPSGKQGYTYIADKFATLDGYGPTSVRNFVEDTDILGERTADQWQTDAFGQVNAFLKALGLV